MNVSNVSFRYRHMIILLVAFLVSVLLRLPNINRPLSKHHEFNTAVILNGIISWKEAGGAAAFNYTPLMTYPGAENRLLQRGPYTDSVGNHLYLSLGPGWYVLPYLVFTALHLPFTPLSLQLLNLLIQLCTLVALYRLAHVITKKYTFLSPHFPIYTSLVFLFLPGPLWYFGNGYVHAAVSLPFAILLFTQFLQYAFFHKSIHYTNVLVWLACGVAGIYIDWFTFFLLGVLAAYAFLLYIKNRDSYWFKIACLSAGTAVAGVALIFLQFAHFTGYQQVVDYWVSRAGERSFNNGNASLMNHLVSLAANLFSCAGISVICTAAVTAVVLRKRPIRFPLLPCLLWVVTCLGYNGLFFNWSYIHEFSMVPVCVVFSMITAFLLLHILPESKARIAFAVLFLINMAQYYYINPPGKTSRVGTPYNDQKLLGEVIKQQIPANYRIFSNMDNSPAVEYYAHRSFVLNNANSLADAQQQCDSLKVPRAVWMKVDSFKIKELQVLK